MLYKGSVVFNKNTAKTQVNTVAKKKSAWSCRAGKKICRKMQKVISPNEVSFCQI
jgi:hypothetical protein